MPGPQQVLRKMLPFCPLIQVSSVTLLTSKTTWEGKAVRERETSCFWLWQRIQPPGPLRDWVTLALRVQGVTEA